jgi:hypothetical protein
MENGLLQLGRHRGAGVERPAGSEPEREGQISRDLLARSVRVFQWEGRRGTRRLVWNWRGELVSLVSTAEVGGSITDKGMLLYC